MSVETMSGDERSLCAKIQMARKSSSTIKLKRYFHSRDILPNRIDYNKRWHIGAGINGQTITHIQSS